MDNMTTNSENKSGISIGLDQLLLEDNKSVQLELNYGQNECNSQRVLKENNTKRGKGLFGKKGRGNNPFWKKTAKFGVIMGALSLRKEETRKFPSFPGKASTGRKKL